MGPSLTRVKRCTTPTVSPHSGARSVPSLRSRAVPSLRSRAVPSLRSRAVSGRAAAAADVSPSRSPPPPSPSGLTTADTAAVAPSVGAVCRRVWRYSGTSAAVPGDHSRHSRRPAACCRSGAPPPPPADAPLAAPLTELHLVTVVIGHQSPGWCVRETVTNAADRPGSWHTRHGTGR